MNYELAKQLKDAGFPQYGSVREYALKTGKVKCIFAPIAEEDEAYIPTLSELIEEVGDKGYFKLECNQGIWTAESNVHDIIEEGEGDSPEEAVANLWLKLNK